MSKLTRDWFIWQMRAVYTQTDVGGGTVVAKMAPLGGEVMELVSLAIGPDNYEAGRNLDIYIEDSAGNNILSVVGGVISIDNVKVNVPGLPAVLAGGNKPNIKDLLIAGEDKLVVSVASLAQNETVTIAIRAKIYGRTRPVTDKSDSGGTVTETKNYNYLM